MAETDSEKEKTHQRGTRLSKLHAEELINLFGGSHAQSEYFRVDDLMSINYAHVVMLCEKNLMRRDETADVLKALKKLELEGARKAIQLDSRVGDLSTHMEAYIIRETGVEIGGKIHTGRSRNDLYPTMTKMLVRRSVLEVYEALLLLNESLLRMCETYGNTVMPGYTQHSQHAQPITFGFYLLGNYDVFDRDLMRIQDLWRRLNTCPMGAAALATTSFPLDRHRVASLLGFDMIQEHAYDAVSSRDFLLEYLFILSTIASNIGRIAENLLYWNTLEFGMLVLSDEFTSFSTIMPQKKNPVALETLRAFSSLISGKLFNAFGILKAMPWSNGRENTILDDDSVETGGKVKNMILLLRGVLNTLTIREDRMHELAGRGFSIATDLADTLVRENGFSFRTAHEIVGLVVKRAIDEGLDSTRITPEMIESGIEAYLGKHVPVDHSSIRKALDPKESVEIRNLPGGPAFEEVLRMRKVRNQSLGTNREFLAGIRAGQEDAATRLDRAIHEIMKGGVE